ncbi:MULTISPECIES: type II toxin-antitoxin system RelE/ParE family toxin [unclassified Sphingomonas]|uniref:type II toxin-antitoxin system RelE/ParE family toxin n=1 Tax=unclassified Sphingomonas TaxID=196159 RepID=UPI001F277A9D|nr:MULTISPECIES: type II toxin-antitoxin system RelE/ParE family toxin [unclassified Sphingomonas]
MRVRWTAQAEADRLAIWDYLAERNPRAAIRIDEAIAATVSRLHEFPHLGHPGAVDGTRELHPIPATASSMRFSGSASGSS